MAASSGMLLAVGACYLDTILTVDYFPSEDSKLRASAVIHRRGGNCPNTVEVHQQLLDRHLELYPLKSACRMTALCCVLPAISSAASQSIRTSLPENVDTSHCIHREDAHEAASSYIIRSQATNSRTIVNYNGLKEMAASEFFGIIDKLGKETGWCHFEGRIPDVTVDCMRYALDRSIRVSIEVEKPGRPRVAEISQLADIVFYSRSYAMSEGYTSGRDFLESRWEKFSVRKQKLFLTWGEEGALAFDMDSAELNGRKKPPFEILKSEPVEEVGVKIVDTIGAGDTFVAGMLYALRFREEWSLQQKLDFAVKLASKKVTQEGFGGLGTLID